MQDGYAGSILAAGGTALLLALVSLLLAVLIGLAGALAKLSPSWTLQAIAAVYTSIVRGVPDLVMMLLVFYALPALLNQGLEAMGSDATVEFSPFVAGSAPI